MVTLRLNERNFSVTRNLWLCLTYLGFHAQRSKARYLWVDAICINQGNVPERNAQVRVMDEIYKNAHHVSIWLGPGLEFYKSWIEGLVGTVDMDGSDWSEVKQLANHEYWSRRWVIQECLLAREIQIHCGSTIMTWGDFQEALSLEANVNLLAPAEDSVITKMLDTKQHGALPLLLARNPVGGFSQRPLEELIIHHRHSRCKDPRDRVFALLGLLENWERRCLERYFPNYSLSHDGVVVITVAHLRELNGASVTLKSQNLFQGLGVESKDRQRRLIAAAEDCPYYIGYDDEIIISDESRQERAGYMGWDGGLEIDQYEEIVDGVQTGDGMGSGVSRCNIL
ncbi:heterokaryon incompatibility protein-domain-containing protein [Nemania sp. FL0031]|nr:heterokaryon incompatibility protein-domain-containing protein [Nemania sp. FL0031]